MFRYRVLGLFVGAVFVCLLASCQQSQDGAQRFSLSGEIKVDGKPVPAGEIMFEPDTSQGNSGPAGVAEIKDGRYSTLPEMGTVGGPQIAVISANKGIILKENGETPQGWLILDGFRMTIDLPRKSHTENLDISSTESEEK